MSVPRFSAESELRKLHDFQRRSVEHVFRRFYIDEDVTRRFLVADEVGLGKTMVARGVIARAIERLQNRVRRIDVIYVCSNQAIAQQNINRLSISEVGNRVLATRLTLLPLELRGERSLRENKVNFISFTPGTTFEMKSSAGTVKERTLLYGFLRKHVTPSRGLYNLLQAWASRERWDSEVANLDLAGVDERIAAAFRAAIASDASLSTALTELCKTFHRNRRKWPVELQRRRNEMIGALRNRLARVCLDALEPDLVILDEFQRFKDLLHGHSEAAELARELFDYVDERGNQARTLLLSATPYRMLTLGNEQGDDDHYRDFVETLRFLFGGDDESAVAELETELRHYRRAILGLPQSARSAAAARDRVQALLKKVMLRTERVGATAERDAMLVEHVSLVPVSQEDLCEARLMDRLALALAAPDVVDLWKSSPFLLNFMRDYVLKQRLREAVEKSTDHVRDLIATGAASLIMPESVDRYIPLPSMNGRMAQLRADMIDNGLWRLLWLPPSLPCYQPQEPFAQISHATKALVFSAWNVAPDAISAVLSYDAERRMVRQGMRYSEYSRRPRLLRFSLGEEGRRTGMTALALLYPCIALASAVDPLAMATAAKRPLDYREARTAVREHLLRVLEGPNLPKSVSPGPEDQRWYWAILAGLERPAEREAIARWCGASGDVGWLGTDQEEAGFAAHARDFADVLLGNMELGRPPHDLEDVLVDFALGSPAICALRALRRIAPDVAWDHPVLLTAAARVAQGFRTLFNHADVIAYLRAGQEETAYWRHALGYAVAGNLQAVLDEYAHLLLETLAVRGRPGTEIVPAVANAMHAALSLRPAQIELDTYRADQGRLEHDTFRMRGRFAMRLAEYRDEEGTVGRLGLVREAFNSPFQPFVLATTSIGQEGLDFHPYCHRVYHWNLPANPVDLEQREGRVHRYKGHAVRLNIADRFGFAPDVERRCAARQSHGSAKAPRHIPTPAARAACSSFT